MELGMVGASFDMISEQSTGNRELESGVREQGSEIREQGSKRGADVSW